MHNISSKKFRLPGLSPQFDHINLLITHFLFWTHPEHAQYFIEQYLKPIIQILQKLPIIQKIIREYLAQAYSLITSDFKFDP